MIGQVMRQISDTLSVTALRLGDHLGRNGPTYAHAMSVHAADATA
jgi:hypothetical protein